MRCYTCNVLLTTEEACSKFKGSGEYTEMCTKCLRESDLLSETVKQARQELADELDEEIAWTPEEESAFNNMDSDEC